MTSTTRSSRRSVASDRQTRPPSRHRRSSSSALVVASARSLDAGIGRRSVDHRVVVRRLRRRGRARRVRRPPSTDARSTYADEPIAVAREPAAVVPASRSARRARAAPCPDEIVEAASPVGAAAFAELRVVFRMQSLVGFAIWWYVAFIVVYFVLPRSGRREAAHRPGRDRARLVGRRCSSSRCSAG